MDFQGQRLAELIFYWIILSFGAVGWIIGYFQQDFTIVFQAWLAGVLLSVVVCLLTRECRAYWMFAACGFVENRPNYFIVEIGLTVNFSFEHSFASRIGRSTTDIRSSGLNRFQTEGNNTSNHRDFPPLTVSAFGLEQNIVE